MNFAGKIIISLCRADQVSSLAQFIDTYWKKGHILSQSPEILRWQHLNQSSGDYNFALTTSESGEILGVLGFIPSSKFSLINEDDTVWMALWKVIPGLTNPGIGLKLRSFVFEKAQPALYAVVGAGVDTLTLYSRFGFEVGSFKQYVIVNPDISVFSIVGGNPSLLRGHPALADNSAIEIREIEEIEEIIPKIRIPSGVFPLKNANYLINRYASHPVYKYRFFAVSKNDDYIGLAVGRLVSHETACALRIVDYIGQEIGFSGVLSEWQRILRTLNAEYVDVLAFGIDEKFFLDGGFTKVDSQSTFTAPNYFEPFRPSYSEVHLAYKFAPGRGASKDERYIAFKGDGDQDRPNQLPG